MIRRSSASVATLGACVIGAVTACAAAPSPGMAAAASPAAKQAADSGTRTVPSAATQAEPNIADRRYVRRMIPHHYQALVMTELAPERSPDEQVRGLAARIHDAQRVEIGAMQGWQGRRGLQVSDPAASYRRVLQDPELLEAMGMATPDELDRLRAAQGKSFDVAFLRLMIKHHQGAIAMAESVAANGRDVTVRQMALDVIATQSDQVSSMRELLDRKTG